MFNLLFDKHTVLITGGSGGLGAPTALAFAEAGAKVIVLDRNALDGLALTRRISLTAAQPAIFVEQDLTDIRATTEALTKLALPNPIDILINNAAVYPSKPLAEYSSEEFEAVQRVNVTAAFNLVQVVLPGMLSQGWGRIINVSSITRSGGWANLAPYVVSKGALISLTRAIAREYGSSGITANAICPGAFPTDAEKIHTDSRYQRWILENQAIGRRGVPMDFVFAVLSLASEFSGFITGQSLNVDGGWLME